MLSGLLRQAKTHWKPFCEIFVSLALSFLTNLNIWRTEHQESAMTKGCSLLSPLKTSVVYHFPSVKSSSSFPCTASVYLLDRNSNQALNSQETSYFTHSMKTVWYYCEEKYLRVFCLVLRTSSVSLSSPHSKSQGTGQGKRKPHCLHWNLWGTSLFESKVVSWQRSG